jgi:hypothetical protein
MSRRNCDENFGEKSCEEEKSIGEKSCEEEKIGEDRRK